MPKKKSLWMRETPCLVCEQQVVNYQFMTKSHTFVYDEWMVMHTHPLAEYEAFPDEMKTTICPKCLFASNEYSYGVDDYKYFFRSPSKNDRIKEWLMEKDVDRFLMLKDLCKRYEKEAAAMDARSARPQNTRSVATIEKLWQNRDEFGVKFFSEIIFQNPRDLVTVLICFGMDRYCQMLRIAYNYDVEPVSWKYDDLKEAIVNKFRDEPLSIKQPEPRFYYLTTNYLQTIQYHEKLKEEVPESEENQKEFLEDCWSTAHVMVQLCMDNDDVSAVPIETKDGGLNLLKAKLDFRFGDINTGKKCLRFAKSYGDNRMKRISSQNQQNFVNEVDELYKHYFQEELSEEEEGKE